MPSVAEPDLDASWPLSPRIWSTNAEEDRDSATAMTMASSHELIVDVERSAKASFCSRMVPTELPKGTAKSTKAHVVVMTCTQMLQVRRHWAREGGRARATTTNGLHPLWRMMNPCAIAQSSCCSQLQSRG